MWKQNQKQPLYFKAFFKALIGFVTQKKISVSNEHSFQKQMCLWQMFFKIGVLKNFVHFSKNLV